MNSHLRQETICLGLFEIVLKTAFPFNFMDCLMLYVQVIYH